VTASFRSVGTANGSISTASPGNPAGIIAGDLLLCVVETDNQNSAGVPTTSTGTWAEVTGSPQGTGPAGAAGGTGLRVYWKWSVGASEGATTVPDSGVFTDARIYAYQNVSTGTGTPWDVTNGVSDGTGGTSGSAPGVTTTAAGELVVVIVSNAVDSASAQYSGGFTNANLSGVTDRGGDQWLTQNGGGYTVMDGTDRKSVV